MKYRVEKNIDSNDIQSDLYIRFPHLVKLFQDVAFEHSNYLGLGVEVLIKMRLSWVLYANYIKVFNYPKLSDKLTITTWVKNKNGITVQRDFEVKNGNKNILYATNLWVLFNIDKRQAIQFPDEIISMYEPEDSDILPEVNYRLPYDKNINYEYTFRFNTRFFDLDANEHVNNITYIDFVYTAIYRMLKKVVFIKDFNITYKKEITISDEIIEVQLNHNHDKINFRIVGNNVIFSYGSLAYSDFSL